MQNPSYERFKAEMEAAGVLVFDPAPVLLERKQQTGQPQFLKTDTHWTPDAMQAVAERLNEFIAEHVALPAQPALDVSQPRDDRPQPRRHRRHDAVALRPGPLPERRR